MSVSDSNNNYFPVDRLDASNFNIFEISEDVEKKIKIIKVEPIEESSSRIYISIVLDCSDSMKEEKKLERSKEAIASLLNGLKQYPNLQCGVAVYFVNSQNLGWAEGKFFSLDEFDTLINIVRRIEPFGATPLWEGIINVLDNCLKNKPYGGYQIVICLTDGLDSGLTQSTFEGVKAKIVVAKTPFVFIGYGNEDYSDLIYLSKLSGAGDMGVGHFIKVNPEKIEHIFENVARSITKSYKIYWNPADTTKKGDVKVRIKIKYRSPYGKITAEDFATYKLQ